MTTYIKPITIKTVSTHFATPSIKAPSMKMVQSPRTGYPKAILSPSVKTKIKLK